MNLSKIQDSWKNRRVERFQEIFSQYGTILVILFLGGIFSVTTDHFSSTANLQNILRQISITSIVAIGMTLVILIGGIDLSVGSVVLFSAAAMNSLIFNQILPTVPAVVVGLLAASFIGFLNGVLIEKARISPVVVTLSSMTAARGLGQMILWINNSWLWVREPFFVYIKTQSWWVIPVPAGIMIILYILAYIIMTQTRFGRYVYAIGNNQLAAKLTGVAITRVKVMIYSLSGFFAGIGGILMSARLSAISPGVGQGLEFDAITAVILGGTSLSGGVGKVQKTILGAIIVGMILNYMTIKGISAHYQRAVTGFIILAAAILDRFSQGKNRT